MPPCAAMKAKDFGKHLSVSTPLNKLLLGFPVKQESESCAPARLADSTLAFGPMTPAEFGSLPPYLQSISIHVFLGGACGKSGDLQAYNLRATKD